MKKQNTLHWVFDRHNIECGDILHVRSNTPSGRFLRWGMNKWAKRICKQLDVPRQEVWGNHDGIIVAHPATGELGVGEALTKGSVFTPLTKYERSMAKNKHECRVFRAGELTPTMRRAASHNWWAYVKGTGYDFAAYGRLMLKSLFMDWEYSDCHVLRDIGERAAGHEWDNWCTQGVGNCYAKYAPPEYDVFQTRNPTPMTVEQVVGDLPKRPGKLITLVNITSDVLIPTVNT